MRLLPLVVAAVLLAPATAAAEKLCVNTPDCPGGTMAAGVQAALDDAEASSGATEVVLGPGTYTSSTPGGYAYTPPAGDNPLTLVGAGPATILQGDESTNTAWQTLSINTAPGIANVVRDLRLRIPLKSSASGSARDGLALHSGTAENVVVEDRGDGASGIVATTGSTLRRIDLSMNPNGAGVIVTSGAGATLVEDAIVRSGRTGVAVLSGSVATLRRADVTTSFVAAAAYGGSLTVESSLLRVTGAPVVAGDGPAPIVAETVSGLDATVDARQVTAIGPGTAESDGARARSGDAGRTASVVLDSVIVRDVGAALHGKAFGGAYAFTTRYSDYAAGTNVLPAGGTASEGPGNIDADPLFADPAAFDYDLRAGSPAIDAGNPSPPASGPDLRGRERTVDGNGDGSAVGDMGAFEARAPTPAPGPGGTTPPPPPPPPGGVTPPPDLVPVLSGLRVERFVARVGRRLRLRHRLRFRLSEPASLLVVVDRAVRGRRVRGRCRTTARRGRRCIRWVRRATLRRTRRAGAGTVLLPSALKRGRYRVTIRPTDAAGNRGARRRVSFSVRRRRG